MLNEKNEIFEKRIDVLGASKYNFVNDNGEVVQGCKISVISSSNNDNQVGQSISQINLDYKEFNKFELAKFPCKCIIAFTINDFNKKPRIDSIKLV